MRRRINWDMRLTYTHTTYKVSNKDLPSSAGNYIQYLIITYNGKEIEKNAYMYLCVFLWLFSHSVMSDSLPPYGLQHARLLCPSSSPRICSNSCPLSQWYPPTISSSVIPFSPCPQSFPASGSFPMSQFSASGSQILKFQLQHQSFQWIFRTDFL